MPDETGKIYRVEVTATAREAILQQARYIAIDQRSPQNAAEWLDRIWTLVDGLEYLPKRHVVAQGYEQLPYVVRRVLVDNHFILFTIDDTKAIVYIVGLRHGASLADPAALPTAISDPR